MESLNETEKHKATNAEISTELLKLQPVSDYLYDKFGVRNVSGKCLPTKWVYKLRSAPTQATAEEAVGFIEEHGFNAEYNSSSNEFIVTGRNNGEYLD